MSYFIGIDGGGTATNAVLIDAAGNDIARAQGPTGRLDALDPAALAPALAALARLVLVSANAERASALCCALSGAGRAADRVILEAALRGTGVADTVIVVPDFEGAMQDAFGNGAGILLISGTGSSAWGRSESGSVARCGGWGYLLGDEGSAYAIGLAAIRAALHAHDGRAGQTELLPFVLRHAEANEPDELIRWSAAATRADIAALAPGTIELASTDAAAAGITDAAARELAEHIAALHARLGPWSATVPIAFTGGLISVGRPLRAYLESALVEWQLDIALLDREIDAALGAAMLARSITNELTN
ncbi:MAG: BadF/BadG/BcrA/BcrD ATPase family protein [Gemmatimonadota bacterium]